MCVWSDTRTAMLANGCAPRRGYHRHLANRCKQSQDQCCILQGHACEYITIGRNWVVAICIPQYTWVVNCIFGFGPKAMIYLCEKGMLFCRWMNISYHFSVTFRSISMWSPWDLMKKQLRCSDVHSPKGDWPYVDTQFPQRLERGFVH